MEGVRRATVGDLDVMAELTEAAIAEQIDSRGGFIWAHRETRPRPYRMSLEGTFHDPDAELWVGTIDDVIVGYGACHLEVLANGDILGRVTDLYVDPAAREVAVGEGLVDEMIAWCRERGCVGVDALALPGNRETKNFFETFGFTARLLVVHHRLRADEGAT